MLTINGKTITTVPEAISDQPGFGPEGHYMVARATTGGYRLYRAVGGNWMDASLNDDPRLGEFAITGASALGSIRTPKKAASSRENGKKGGRPLKMRISQEVADNLFNRVINGRGAPVVLKEGGTK